MADQVQAQPSLTAVLAVAIETQRNVLRTHAALAKKKLKPRAIHELRVALRRLLTTLALAEALGLCMEARSLRRVRKLLSRLAPARDAHVQMQSLASLMPTHPGNAALLEALAERRQAAARQARKHFERFPIADFDRDISLVVGGMNAGRSATKPSAAIAAAVLGQLAQRQLDVERQRRGASASDPVALHGARLALKDYRYALDALLPLLPEAAKAVAKTCEQLQNQLGSAHDAHVLAQTARKLAEAQPAHASAALLDLASRLDQVSASAHAAAAQALAAASLPWPWPDPAGF